MNSFNLPLFVHFSKLHEKPKWLFKFILSIIIFSLSKVIGFYNTDIEKIYNDINMSTEQITQVSNKLEMATIIGAPIIGIIKISFTFIIILILSKSIKRNVKVITLWSATLSYSLITGVVSLIIIIIQYILNLPLTDYRITSLNVFSKGNSLLELFDFQVIIGAYVVGIMLRSITHCSKKISWLFAFSYIFIIIGLGLIGVISSLN